MDKRKKVAFYTLGCKLNFSETSTIARSFTNEGFDRVDFSEKADMYVINTCTVTENADNRFKKGDNIYIAWTSLEEEKPSIKFVSVLKENL